MEETGAIGPAAPAFEAEVIIGKGWRTVDRKGRLTIAGDWLTLSHSSRRVCWLISPVRR